MPIYTGSCHCGRVKFHSMSVADIALNSELRWNGARYRCPRLGITLPIFFKSLACSA